MVSGIGNLLGARRTCCRHAPSAKPPAGKSYVDSVFECDIWMDHFTIASHAPGDSQKSSPAAGYLSRNMVNDKRLDEQRRKRMPRSFRRTLWSIAVLGWLLAACSRPSWQQIVIPEGGFSINMRGSPVVEKNDLDLPIGRVTGHWYS